MLSLRRLLLPLGWILLFAAVALVSARFFGAFLSPESRALRVDIRAASEVGRCEVDSCEALQLGALAGFEGMRRLPPEISRLLWLKELDLGGGEIESLEGIEPLFALERVNLSYSQVTDLEPLPRTPTIRELVLNGVKAMSFEPVAAYENLTVFAAGWTKFDDVSLLMRSTDLQRLHLPGSQVRDLSSLEKHTNLRLLDVRQTSLDTLDTMPELPTLEVLKLDDAAMVTLSGIERAQRLRELHMRGLGILDLSPISTLKQLERLHLDRGNFPDISPLSLLPRLSYVSVIEARVDPAAVDQLRRAGVTVEEFAAVLEEE